MVLLENQEACLDRKSIKGSRARSGCSPRSQANPSLRKLSERANGQYNSSHWLRCFVGAEQLFTDKDIANLWNPGLLSIFFFCMKNTDFSIKLFFGFEAVWMLLFHKDISPIDPHRLFIDGDKYCLTFLFIICSQTRQRAWLNHALHQGSFSVGLDLVLSFHLYQTI